MRQSIGTQHPATGAFAPVAESEWGQAPWPLGAHPQADGSCTFAVYAAAAEKVVLELYLAAVEADAAYDYDLRRGTDGIWRGRIASVPAGALYGLRAWGPNWRFDPTWRRGNSAAGFLCDVDAAGNRFNPNKLLFDPYARELSHPKVDDLIRGLGDDGGIYGTGGADVSLAQTYVGALAHGEPTDRRRIDTGPRAPKGVVVRDATDFGTKPAITAADAAIYEAHVRGLTQHPSASRLKTLLRGLAGFEAVVDVPPPLRGTYAGAALMPPYLKALGYNAIELLPVHETLSGDNPADRPGGNFWGYMTYGYFAPDRRYAADRSPGGPTREFKKMVAAFHAAGIEVYLDVVFNHTGEGGVWDGTRACAEILSFRGLDNAAYYSLVPSDASAYWESTGCGNNLNASNPTVRALVLDSLRYWTDEMGVDGFRFDLAPVLGREAASTFGFNPQSRLLTEIADLAQARNIEVIAEAWDTAGGGYQVGNFPHRWAEWNGRWRDTVRRFMKGSLDGDITPAEALHGDYLHFADQGGPDQSVNFICAHDGFTLADLVSYDQKNNQVGWPFGPSDGGNDTNDSWGSGWVPPGTGCPDVHAFRRQRFRNFWAFQWLCRGVPMTVYGDELARTQNGNNNPYNIDSVATWNNYDMLATSRPHRVATGSPGEPYHDNFGTAGGSPDRNPLFAFARYMVGLRSSSAALRQGTYDMSIYYSLPEGQPGYDGRLHRAFRVRIDGSGVGDRDFLLLINMETDPIRFLVEPPDSGAHWRRIIDTAYWAEAEHANSWPLARATVIDREYSVNACSIVVLSAA
jgi:glycogen operon protein